MPPDSWTSWPSGWTFRACRARIRTSQQSYTVVPWLGWWKPGLGATAQLMASRIDGFEPRHCVRAKDTWETYHLHGHIHRPRYIDERGLWPQSLSLINRISSCSLRANEPLGPLHCGSHDLRRLTEVYLLQLDRSLRICQLWPDLFLELRQKRSRNERDMFGCETCFLCSQRL